MFDVSYSVPEEGRPRNIYCKGDKDGSNEVSHRKVCGCCSEHRWDQDAWESCWRKQMTLDCALKKHSENLLENGSSRRD